MLRDRASNQIRFININMRRHNLDIVRNRSFELEVYYKDMRAGAIHGENISGYDIKWDVFIIRNGAKHRLIEDDQFTLDKSDLSNGYIHINMDFNQTSAIPEASMAYWELYIETEITRELITEGNIRFNTWFPVGESISTTATELEEQNAELEEELDELEDRLEEVEAWFEE